MSWFAKLRQHYLSRPLMRFVEQRLPPISRTEQDALDSGNVWWDAELFSGNPDWCRLRDLSISQLSAEEQAFLDGPVEELCRNLDDWQITHELLDLPPDTWAFLKQQRFFGMIIPKQYGGLGFSALAHSQVVMKIASRSVTAAVTVMVPNSLGPGELLIKYGTQAQKEHYLPRLADGRDIPCFGLTGPEAGSDAGSIPDNGIVCRQDFNGQPAVLGIRLNWEKRYITLGPVATLLGLAFRLYDPEHLLGDKEDIGITLALIPTDHPGVEIGNRHFALDIPFQNGPNKGKDVFIPMDWLIGGQEQVGNGWRMLVEALGEGRGISLPALSTGAAKMVSRYVGAYARVRQQFGLPIGHFEGVEEPLAHILGNTYLMDAGRILTATAIDQGQRPAVITALLKYQLTEAMRKLVNDAMDIAGGAGICMGPSNYLARAYQSIPIGITVEGANILTRSLIVFGQGAIRNHPWLLQEIQATQSGDVAAFERAAAGHLGHIVRNLGRSVWYGLTNAIFTVSGTPMTRHYYRHLTRLSSQFALLSDFALLSLGGDLKRRERLSGRMADILANLYLCSAVLKHFEEQGQPETDLPLLEYACRLTIHRTQQAMLAAFHNLPLPWLAKLLRTLMFPYGKPFSPPDDALIHRVARLALEPSATRDRLTQGIYLTNDPNDRMGRIEDALHKALAATDVEKQFRKLLKDGKLAAYTTEAAFAEAKAKGLLDAFSVEKLLAARRATANAVRVDDFPAEYFRPHRQEEPPHHDQRERNTERTSA
ncbi:acyl-CoA dehydrogenase [Thiothrix subterranea]|uniref:Acyl-coenzyme A dehydrogenase n=1 Tax=Thiothrix subterranea TaxID=2735563 RepID=A0ABU0Y7H7_9GAMM|nr:acyl-CoA dehydrogenase [Thiothrix subterranea]MDQ5768738.1 acyl-CoA dehydrogenase [Thiothrix subterranea]